MRFGTRCHDNNIPGGIKVKWDEREKKRVCEESKDNQLIFRDYYVIKTNIHVLKF